MVQDREARRRGKAIVRQPRISCIGHDDVDIGSGQTLSQGFAQRGIDLHGGDARHPLAQEIGGEAGSRTDLEDVIAEIASGLYPGQQFCLEHLGPLGAGQELHVGLIHALTCTMSGAWPSLHNRTRFCFFGHGRAGGYALGRPAVGW